MKVIQMTPQQQASVKVLQDGFKAAQTAHVSAYKQLLTHLQSISGVQAEQGRKTKIAISDDGQHIIVGS